MATKKRKSTKGKDHNWKKIIKKIKPVKKTSGGLKAVLYGKAGSGKTTLACTFPGPALILDVKEKGTDSVLDVKGLKVIQVDEWDEVQDVYWMLKKSDHPFKTVIWDTVSQVQDLYIIELLQESNRDVDNPGGWGTMTKKMWGEVSNKLKAEIVNWRDLDMNVVFIAHDRVFVPGGDDEERDESEEILPSVGPRVMPSVADVLNAAVGVIGNCFVRQHIKPRRKLKSGKIIKEKRRIEYCLRIGPNAIYATKMRKPRKIMLPDILVDPTYKSIVDLSEGKEE